MEEIPLEDMNREELYEVAQDLDISGRSKLDKDELLAAIEKEQAKRAAPPKPKPSKKTYSYDELLALRTEMEESRRRADRAMNTHQSLIKIQSQGGIPRIPISQAEEERRLAAKEALAATRRFEAAKRSSR